MKCEYHAENAVSKQHKNTVLHEHNKQHRLKSKNKAASAPLLNRDLEK